MGIIEIHPKIKKAIKKKLDKENFFECAVFEDCLPMSLKKEVFETEYYPGRVCCMYCGNCWPEA